MPPTDPDIPSAALRLAAHARYAAEPMHAVQSDDLRAILPVLEALAAGAGAGRVERMARAICVAVGDDPNAPLHDPAKATWRMYEVEARAAIALADAERAAEAAGPIPPAAMALATEAWGEAWTANEAGSLAAFGRAYAGVKQKEMTDG